MRDLLTGLAILLIIALTALLVTPYLVDWNGQRGFLESQLSRVFGQPVTIGGNIDLKLLPTPYLRLNQAVIGNDDGAVRVGIRHLDLEMNITSLLHGEIDIIEGRLDEPTIRLTLQTDRNLPTLPDTPALRAKIRLERIQVVDGTLAIADPQSGRTLVVDHLDFSAEAPSLAGPFKIAGSEGPSGARSKFRMSTSPPAKGKTRLHLTLEETAGHPGLDLDGELALIAVAKDRLRQSFDGRMVVAGHLAETGGKAVGWRLSGPLAADPQSASVTQGDLRIGDDTSGLTLHATGQATFGDAATMHLKLESKQIDIDRLSGSPVDASQAAAPPKLPDAATLKQLVAAITPPLPTSIEINIDSAIWGGETLEELTAQFALGGQRPAPIRLSGHGPGGLHVDLRGTMATRDATDGDLECEADDLPTALRWLTKVAAVEVPTDLPVRSLALAAHVKSSATGFDLSNLTLALDGSKLDGSLQATFGRPAKVTADLRSPRLDLGSLPDLTALRSRATPLDVALKLDAGSVRIAKLGRGPLDAGRVKIDVALLGRKLVTNSFEAADLGGARILGHGTIDDAGSSLTLALDATRLDQAAELARQLAPGRVTDALVARTAALVPAKLDIDAEFGSTADGRIRPRRLSVVGQTADTRLDLRLSPEPTGNALTLTAQAQAPRGAPLLRQLGLPVAVDAIGASQVSLTANGQIERPLATRLDVTLGDTAVGVVGSFDGLSAGNGGGSGTMTVKSADLGPMLQTFGLAAKDMTGAVPADLSAGLAVGATGIAVSDLKGHFNRQELAGTLKWQSNAADRPALTGSLTVDRLQLGSLIAAVAGPTNPPRAGGATWSDRAFAPGLAEPPRSAVLVHARTLDLGFGLLADDAAMEVGIAPRLLTLKHATARLRDGRLNGEASMRRDAGQVSVEGSLAFNGISVSFPPLTATLAGTLDFAGSGSTPMALVSSLAGTGEADLTQTTITGVNAGTLPSLFAAVEDDTLADDDETISRAFEQGSKGSLDFGARQLTASLVGGALALTARDTPVARGAMAASLDGNLDLRQPKLDVRVAETLTSLPKDWAGPPPAVVVRHTAGLGEAPKRSFDIAGFVSALAARAIARESARIESYEFDVRERALFNARLEADRHREQDRMKAEADAKAAAEAARKADAERRAEAARLERQRQDSPDDPEPNGRREPAPLPLGRPSTAHPPAGRS